MAFQADSAFLAFLQTCARDAALRVQAAGQNFILDESEAEARENDYLARVAANHLTGGKPPFDFGTWAEAHKAIGEELVAAKASGSICITFDTPNAANLTLSTTLEPNTQVVRLESINGLFHKVFKGDYDEPMQVYQDLGQWTAAQSAGRASADAFPRLQDWLKGINEERDQRPAWVTTYAAASVILSQRAWALRLRDALGLAHFTAVGTTQFPVVLMQYPLSECSMRITLVPDGLQCRQFLMTFPERRVSTTFSFPPRGLRLRAGWGRRWICMPLRRLLCRSSCIHTSTTSLKISSVCPSSLRPLMTARWLRPGLATWQDFAQISDMRVV